MIAKVKAVVIITIVVGVLLSGACIAVPPPTAPAAGQPAAQSNPGAAPDELQTLEADAEDIIDIAPTGRWERITKDSTKMATAWQTYLPTANAAGATPAMQEAMTGALDHLQRAAESQDAVATMQAANDVSAVVVELFDLYHPAIPADIGRLDVLERQLILDVATNDYTKAQATFAKTEAVWANVKPSVLDHQGDVASQQFAESLQIQAQALQAKDAAALTAEAKNGLELVDVLERLY